MLLQRGVFSTNWGPGKSYKIIKVKYVPLRTCHLMFYPAFDKDITFDRDIFLSTIKWLEVWWYMTVNTQDRDWRVLRSGGDCGKQKSAFFIVIVGEPLRKSSQLLSFRNVSQCCCVFQSFQKKPAIWVFMWNFPVLNIRNILRDPIGAKYNISVGQVLLASCQFATSVPETWSWCPTTIATCSVIVAPRGTGTLNRNRSLINLPWQPPSALQLPKVASLLRSLRGLTFNY